MQLFNHPVFYGFLLCVTIQLIAWYQQKRTSNADSVDIAWTFGILICAVTYVLLVDAPLNNVIMVMIFPLTWYGRLLYHLLLRYDVNHEDSRYQNLREHWSEHTQLKFLTFFQFQAMLSVIFSLTAYWVLTSPEVSSTQMVFAALLGLSALVGVSISDHQLHKFKKNNDSSQVCDIGLWRYSRHPNYFFEWLHWFVYPILLWHSEYFWWSFLVVAVMLLFLLKLTGIPFSEQQALKKRGQAYRDYMEKTSPFIPWIPKQ
ncbi:DUF1295 domain-containing protein [Marinicella sp. S1101]|uniref:DUF1295 domain-containing protein n=1 Tax=Marinicella marina TaxID=2996016 RepID=UPI002260B369|nr:DUF1295 domain-containing protein [Marinicella marina]MCX7553928.1 DUF1295 domain-containing protein [Marinicella marina]MDJ1140420.1 DUF1295 domain-containing protein [Marinicella marina]